MWHFIYPNLVMIHVYQGEATMLRRTTKATAFVLIFVITTYICSHQKGLLSPVLAQDLPGTVVTGTNGTMTPQGAADPHMRMTPVHPATPDDITKADQLAQQVRRAIAQYPNVRDAEKAGYIQFPPKADDLTIVHYVNPWLSYLETWRLDPKQPGSLLYERQTDGSLHLLGAMFTAPAEMSLEDLNKRVPLSVTRWHLHTNICVPEPIWDEAQWARQRNGQPLFGPDSPIATEKECSTVGGKFNPTIFGWMVHANVFAENPADVWNPMYGHAHREMHDK